MSVLVIAEKPSVAKDIAKVLGCLKKGSGYFYSEKYVISWAIGHLVGPADPEDYDAALKKWSFNTLPILPAQIKLKVLPHTKQQFEILKRLMNANETESIVCATDSGREGELIFRYIYSAAGCNKPFERLWISSLTDTAIKKGFQTLKSGAEYDNLYKSARCRSEADWLVGINASRAFTLRYDEVLPIGRVQTPTLSMLVSNKKEIEAFVPEKYWEVNATFAAEGGVYGGIWFELKAENDAKVENTRIGDKDAAKAIVDKVRDKDGVVTEVKTEEKRKPPPLLFDLTELQRECNRKLSLSAQKTLDIAQSLYEKHKAITYPRTDSRHLTNDMAAGLRRVLESLTDSKLAKLAAYPLSLPQLPITKRIVDDSKVTDHHAIIPTGKRAANLSELEAKVYDLIARRLIAAFYKDYTYLSSRIVTVCENESFLSRGTIVTDSGWTLVLGKDAEKSPKKGVENEDVSLPPLSIGDAASVTEVKSAQKSTQPPKPYTEATLLSAMEHAGRFVDDEALKEQLKEAGLGTPATRAATIEKLIEKGYVKREKKSLVATDKGVKLIEIVPKELKTPETTAKWERALSQISKGTMDTVRFNGSIERYVRHIVNEARTAKTSVVFEKTVRRGTSKGGSSANGKALPSFGKCVACGSDVYENSKSYYCSNWRSGCKFTIWKNALEKSGGVLTGEMVREILEKGRADNIPVVLTSTKQRGTCTLTVSKDEYLGRVNIVNFTEKPTEKSD